MVSENGNSMVMPVAPAYANGGGFGNFGGDGWWILLLLLFAGGWGNGFGGGMWGMDGIYPWMNQANLTSNGFQNQLLNDNITSIRDGVHGISTQLCNGFAGVNQNVSNGFAQAEISNNARQMADMQQMFGIQSALQNCCCENRAGIADLKYTVATENCADRQALSDGVRDIIANNTAQTQAILDKLCQQELDAKNETIANLRTQLNMQNLAASQTAQTAQILANNAAQTQALEQYLNPAPIPAYVVQNPNCCPTQNNCGCNCGCGVG